MTARTPTSARKFCSRLALAAEEPLAGSAMHYVKYIFIGLPKGQWAANAAMSKGVPEDLAKLLKTLKGDPRRVAVRFFNMKTDGDETDIILCPDMIRYKSIPMENMATVIEGMLDGHNPDTDTETLGGKHLFVCAHGVRDMCCAKFGFGTIRGVRNRMETHPTQHDWHLWEVTHLVGDRFAGTAVQFPEGHMYGYLSEDIAADWLTSIDAGRIDLPRYRGNIYFQTKQQVAEIAVLNWLEQEALKGQITLGAESDEAVDFDVLGSDGTRTRGTVNLESIQVSYFTNCKFAELGQESVKQSWVAKDVHIHDR